jgi:hypothetical protein
MRSSSSHKPLAQLMRVSSVKTPRVAHSSIHVCWLQVQPGGGPCWSAARGPTAAAAAGYSHHHERHRRGSRWQVSCAVLSAAAQQAVVLFVALSRPLVLCWQNCALKMPVIRVRDVLHCLVHSSGHSTIATTVSIMAHAVPAAAVWLRLRGPQRQASLGLATGRVSCFTSIPQLFSGIKQYCTRSAVDVMVSPSLILCTHVAAKCRCQWWLVGWP